MNSLKYNRSYPRTMPGRCVAFVVVINMMLICKHRLYEKDYIGPQIRREPFTFDDFFYTSRLASGKEYISLITNNRDGSAWSLYKREIHISYFIPAKCLLFSFLLFFYMFKKEYHESTPAAFDYFYTQAIWNWFHFAK